MSEVQVQIVDSDPIEPKSAVLAPKKTRSSKVSKPMEYLISEAHKVINEEKPTKPLKVTNTLIHLISEVNKQNEEKKAKKESENLLNPKPIKIKEKSKKELEKEELEKIADLTRNASIVLRETVWSIKAEKLTLLSLTEKIKEFFHRLEKEESFSLNISIQEEQKEFTPLLALNLFCLLSQCLYYIINIQINL